MGTPARPVDRERKATRKRKESRRGLEGDSRDDSLASQQAAALERGIRTVAALTFGALAGDVLLAEHDASGAPLS